MTLKSEVNYIRRKAILKAKDEMKILILREMTLESEVNNIRRKSSGGQA
jgi:hypothetical protein